MVKQQHDQEASVSQVAPVTVAFVNMVGMFVDLLRSALTAEGSIHITGSAADADELDALFDLSHPDVVLIGTQGWGRDANGLLLLQKVSASAPSVRSVVMGSEMEKEDIVALFHAGARGILCGSGADIPLLLKCIRCVSNGEIWANASQLDLLLRSLSLPRSLKVTNVLGDSLLSKREEQVLHLLADGLSNRELAASLKLSEHTVKNHLFRIFDKLGVSNRMEAVLYAISQRERTAQIQARPAQRQPETPNTRLRYN